MSKNIEHFIDNPGHFLISEWDTKSKEGRKIVNNSLSTNTKHKGWYAIIKNEIT